MAALGVSSEWFQRTYGPIVRRRTIVLEVMDRRRSHRYDLRTRVGFSWEDFEGIRHREESLTRDISEVGVFVLANSCPPVGTTVQFEVCFHSATAQGVQIQAQGRVVRVERADQSQALCGFAAATQAIKVFNHELKATSRRPGGVRNRKSSGGVN
jgi:PilZ domain